MELNRPLGANGVAQAAGVTLSWVIGPKSSGFGSLSLTLILGMFLGGIPEAAASATMLCRAGYSNRTIFLIWSTVLGADSLWWRRRRRE